MSAFDPNATYDKYERYGAYHWRAAAPGLRFWRYSPQSDANYRIVAAQLRRYLSKSARAAVLDVACGDGVMTYRLRRAGWRAVGLDKERLALALTRAALPLPPRERGAGAGIRTDYTVRRREF